MTVIADIRREAIQAPVFTIWVLFLVALFAFGLGSAGYILWNGLEVTNLTNEVPWGLWITIDLTAIALGAGAFSLSAIAYIFRVKNFEVISRMAVFIGLVGYTSAMMALAMDIGRPDRFYYPILYWNIHSVLWEITMCVILYSTVLIVEFVPIFLESKIVSERFPAAPKWGHRLHSLTPFVAVLGLGLSMLHQSSLGATYGVLVARPVWFSPSLPVMFITSAVAAGATFTLGITVFYENLIKERQITRQLRNQVAAFAGLTTLAYLYLKIWDFAATQYYSHLPSRIEDLALLERVTPYGVTFWWIEILMGALVPAVILLTPRLRNVDAWILVATVLAVLGVAVNRWNVTLSGLIVPLDWSPGVAEVIAVNPYQPNFWEFGVGIGIVAYAMLLFTLGLRFLPMYPKKDDDHAH
jgi:menaquinone reductase, integral membrane subunit